MPAQVIVHLGPARAGKTQQMLRLYDEALRRGDGAPGAMRTLWLAPTSRSAALVRQALVDAGHAACLAPGILSFQQLTERILSASDAAPPTAITAAMQRELLRRVIRAELDRGRLVHFAAAAGRSGFVDLLVDHIRELKRHDIGPAAYTKAADQRSRTAEHRELAAVYAAYDERLAASRLIDAEGRQAAARNELADGRVTAFDELELVVVDGFTDFTRVQHELLVLLAARCGALHITLPGEASDVERAAEPGVGGGRCDLFAKVAATLAELKHFHRRLEVRSLPPRPIEWPALAHLERHMFGNPRQIPPLSPAASKSLSRLEIVEAASEQDEIVQIARRIKRQLAGGTARPGEVVVVFRSLGAAAPRVREVFAEYGIPYALESGLPLATAAVLRTLLAVLRLADEDWPFRRVVSVLANTTLGSMDDEARRAADALVHELQIASGRAKLIARTAGLADDDRPEGELTERIRRLIALAREALPALRLLAESLDALPQSALPADWPEALAQLGRRLGVRGFGDRRTEDGALPAQGRRDGPDGPSDGWWDEAAWQAVCVHLAGLARLNASLGEREQPLARRELIQTLADLAGHESLRRLSDEAGRVRVLSAATARSICARHLYLAGMSEQAFPSPERASALCAEADYRFFAGVADQQYAASAPPAATRQQAEMLLFYEALTRAEESLTISYPALDDKAQPLPPSPYVTEIVRALGESAAARRVPPQLSPVPCGDAPSSMTEWRLQAVANAVGGERNLGLLAGVFRGAETRPLAAALEAGLRITHARGRRDEFGPAEGLLISPAAAKRLGRRFGPGHHWSPTQWEDYAVCPYRFFLRDVLAIEPLGDLVLETDYRRRGSLLHRVLATFHRQYGASPAQAWAAIRADRTRFVAALKQTLQAAIDGGPREGIEAAMLELDRRQIEQWAEQYPDQHAKYDGAWAELDVELAPAHFELRFGRKRPGDDGPEDARSVDDALRLDIGGETILVTGRIDRIDVGSLGGRTVFNVIDYKSGRRPSFSVEKVESGERLQPALYVMAAEALVFGPGQATPLWAGYWSMQNGLSTRAQYSLRMSDDAVAPSNEWNELQPKIVRRIGQFVADIRQGRFPVDSRDPDCTSYCDYRTVCRIGQVRSLEKSRELRVESQESKVESQESRVESREPET